MKRKRTHFEGKKRINITLTPALHDWAKQHARQVRHSDFSGLITELLVDQQRLSDAALQQPKQSMVEDDLTGLTVVASGGRPKVRSKDIKALLADFP